MLGILKQIVLFFYFLLVRWSKRKILIDKLVPNHKKRGLDITEIPAVLDELKDLPKEIEDETSLAGFESLGSCIKIHTKRKADGTKTMQLDLDIPGYGYFHHRELKPVSLGFGGSGLVCLDPMRRWQVRFRGYLRHINADGKEVYATILLYWQCFFDPYDYVMSPSCWKLAASMSNLSWKTILTTPLLDDVISYEQWGELRGRIDIEGHEEMNVRFKSVRTREIKRQSTLSNNIIKQHFILKQSGLSFSHVVKTINTEPVSLCKVTFPIADSHTAKLRQPMIGDGPASSELLAFPKRISTCSYTYEITEKQSRYCFSGPKAGFAFKNLVINDKPGFGIEMHMAKLYEESLLEADKMVYELDNIPATTLDLSDQYIVQLDGSACKERALVGGKGYYLALVKSLGHFKVPKGIILTTKAFTSHHITNSVLHETLDKIKQCVSDLRFDKLKDNCDEAVKSVKETKVSSKMIEQLEHHLEEVFGKHWMEKKFAVRSSSIGEDGKQTSAAGHLETFLGIQGLDNVISAIQQCWASSCSYQAVEYRRQNGQELLDSMGVIIQEMVDSTASGVVFTVDPVGNDPMQMIINANYGLGETVVSGVEDVDTVTVDRRDDTDLKVVKLQKGRKETKATTDSVLGTKMVATSESERESLCIDDKQIMHLSKQAIDLENALGMYLDIEWAIEGETLHILQARPVTSLDVVTDNDLLYEFDSPLVNDEELVTPSNVQEMMPGAVSTLTGDLFLRAVDRAINYADCSRIGLKHPVHALSSTLSYSGLMFLNMTHLATRSIVGFGDSAKDDMEFHIVGQPVAEHSVQTLKDFIGKKISIWQRLMTNIRIFITLKRKDSKLFDDLQKELNSLDIGTGVQTPKALYECIDENMMFYFEMWRAYIFKASESSASAALVMLFLKKEGKEISVEALADMALILSDCGYVVSAQVPIAIQDLAESIANSNMKDQFLNMPTEDCESLLRESSNDEIKTAYSSFMEKHGHRGIREADFMEKSWSQDPKNLIESMKQIIKQGAFKKNLKPNMSITDIINGLHTNFSWLQKLLLKRFVVKGATDGVAGRELGKSAIIKCTAIFRVAYWRLAELMVKESRLPEQELLFFLTHKEIGELLESRSAELIRLAKRRKRIFPKRNEIVFQKINIGYPQHVKDIKKELNIPTSFTLQGMPVCRGKAEGRACVIKSLQDVGQLKDGDVMICKFTDVGWSPYFPLISGLVTDMGGLLSHGAVVARECGIPCIVNTENGTDMFKTGDHVILNGAAGTVSKM